MPWLCLKGFLSPDQGLRLEPSEAMLATRVPACHMLARVPACHTKSHPALLYRYSLMTNMLVTSRMVACHAVVNGSVHLD